MAIRRTYSMSDGVFDEIAAACRRAGLRQCWCRKCGAKLSAYAQHPERQEERDSGPPGGWLCQECGGTVARYEARA